MVFSTQWLGYFGIEESYKGESTKRFGYKDIGDFTEFAEIIPQIIGSNIFRASTDKDFTRDLRASSLQLGTSLNAIIDQLMESEN